MNIDEIFGFYGRVTAHEGSKSFTNIGRDRVKAPGMNRAQCTAVSRRLRLSPLRTDQVDTNRRKKVNKPNTSTLNRSIKLNESHETFTKFTEWIFIRRRMNLSHNLSHLTRII